MVSATPPGLMAQDTVSVVPGAQYQAGTLHRLFFGRHHRDLWTTAVSAPVLDLEHLAGGLTAVARGGGQQTRSLRFRGSDGRSFAFRSVEKDPSSLVPEELRGTVANDIIQDQISAGHPVGALVVAPLLAAAGVPHADPLLVVLPDDPRLGEFRSEFAGMLGLFEERPSTDDDTGIIPGAVKVISSDGLFQRVEAGADDQVDGRALLTARLMDVFLGDWDRHRDQWRWATLDTTAPRRWVPIPRDRDQAFVRFDGLLLLIARGRAPQLVNFGRGYPAMVGLTWNGRELDRRFLTGLEWPIWDSAAQVLQGALTDSVIESAVARLPAAYRPLDSARLAQGLKTRRDQLPAAARSFYRLLAGEVDVHATDKRDELMVETYGGDSVRVTLGAEDRQHYFQRTFRHGATREVRVFLHGGADRAQVAGEGSGGMMVRIIGGRGADWLTRSGTGGHPRFYDADSPTTVSGRVDLDPRRYTGDRVPEGKLPPRDWGSSWLPIVWGHVSPDVGLLAGAGIVWTDFGFRQQPFASRHVLRVAYATSIGEGKAEYLGDFRSENSGTRFMLLARASGLEKLRFHGFGNATTAPGPGDFYRIRQRSVALEPALGLPLSPWTLLSVGPTLRYSETRSGNRFIDQAQPYGSGQFGMIGGRIDVLHDTRDIAAFPTGGFLLRATGVLTPALWDVRSTHGTLGVSASTYLHFSHAPGAPVLALRAGGRRVLGDAPFQEAAYIGDAATVRLGRANRFGGDAAVWGNAEVRLSLGGYRLVVPGRWGVFGLGDVGRVFVDGESSRTWHGAYGGGLWFAPISKANTVSVAWAQSAERGRIYLQLGFDLDHE